MNYKILYVSSGNTDVARKEILKKGGSVPIILSPHIFVGCHYDNSIFNGLQHSSPEISHESLSDDEKISISNWKESQKYLNSDEFKNRPGVGLPWNELSIVD